MDIDASFVEFYERDYRRVVGLAYALTGSRSASEELAQDAFVAAYERWDEVGNYDKPEAFVRRVLVNRSNSWGRRKAAEVRAMVRVGGRRALLAELPDADHEFWAAVRALSERQAQAVALFYLEDWTIDDIGLILYCSPGSVKTHLSRGRNALARSLAIEAAPSEGEKER